MDEELLRQLLATFPDRADGPAERGSRDDYLIFRGYVVPRDLPVVE
jgi:hypothetical protein